MTGLPLPRKEKNYKCADNGLWLNFYCGCLFFFLIHPKWYFHSFYFLHFFFSHRCVSVISICEDESKSNHKLRNVTLKNMKTLASLDLQLHFLTCFHANWGHCVEFQYFCRVNECKRNSFLLRPGQAVLLTTWKKCAFHETSEQWIICSESLYYSCHDYYWYAYVTRPQCMNAWWWLSRWCSWADITEI